MDKIARIRQEIERRLDILTNVYAEQVERKDEEMMNYYHGKVIALEELRPFLDTLSEEPDKSLEEAAIDFADNARKQLFTKDYAISSIADYDHGCIDGFKAGAEWQASQMPMPEDTVLFQKGVEEGRRLEKGDMLKDAVKVEGVVIDNGSGGTIIDTQCGVLYLPPLVYAVGEKVRIVVLKKEE